uniref:Zinc finger CCCH-type containing 13 n=1 Tax=Xiphophorus couchianus TaxID=32473 RepID=A0A3B5N137_9TELE
SEVRDDRETREARERRDARERARETTRDSRDNRDGRDLKDSREIKAETRSSRESLERRDREREKERGREKERSDAYRKEEPPPDDRAYGRGHGRDDGGRTESKMDRTERNGRGRGRSNRNSRSSQLDSGYDNWESRSSTVRDRSAERSGNERGSDRTSDRDRYESDRRDHARDSSYDRRGGHGERDHRDNRDRGGCRSPNRYQRRSEESERDERRTDRAEDRRDDRAREREREREKEKEREREREKEREKEREAERERARERVREREREREREEREREREREREEREREREERERERERKEREREREQRERERQREWEERERGREERRERREDSRDERKMSRKRLRVESSPSPQPLPKRAARDFSPADSDGYNSGEDKSGDKHRLLSQVVRPQDRLSRSPPRSAASSEKATYWKDEDRRGARDKRDARGCHDELETRADRGRGGERRGEYLPDATADSRGRGRDQRESTPPPPLAATPVGSEDATVQSHEEGKKKTKMQRKGVKKGRKEEDIPVGAAPAPTEPPASVSADVPPPLHSPRKGAKKKGHERKRKRSPGGESDASEEETAVQAAPSKRKRGPRTPPPSMRPDRHGAATTNTERSPLSKTNNFSDWSDEEESDRGGVADTQAPPPPAERTPAEPLRRVAGHRMGRDRDRGGAPPIAPLLSPDPPMLLQTLTLQPLMSQPLLRKPPPEPVRSSSMGSNQSRASSRRPRSPSSESAHLDDPQGPRLCRGRLQGSNSRDRDRERERERERPMVGDPPGAERKSRIDQLRRGEPSRSTSSDRQDSRSHSSRRSSPDSERQGRSRSRAGSYDSREREPFERERDRKDFRPQQNQQQPPPLHLQQPVQPQRDWEPEPRDWPSRGRDPMLMRPGWEPLPRGERGERDIRERERLLPEGLVQQHERERERERDRDVRGDRGADRERERVMMDLPPHGDLRAAARGDARGDIMRSDFEPLLPREAFSSPEPEKSSNSHHPAGDQREPEKTESIDEDDGKEDEQSIASVGEEYEPISDDELDEILADSQKKEDQQEEEKITGPLDVIDVDWSSLMPKQKQEPRAAGAALLRFTPGAVLLRAGISKRLAGPELLEQVKEVCKSELDDPKDTDKLFEHDLGALNMAAVNRRVERAGLLSNLGPCCKALCARRDFAIRRQLLKNEKGQTKQYPTTPVVDNELLQMSIRLFRRTMAGQTSAPERSESGAVPAGEAAETGSSKLSTAQPEVCVS